MFYSIFFIFFLYYYREKKTYCDVFWEFMQPISALSLTNWLVPGYGVLGMCPICTTKALNLWSMTNEIS